MIRILSLAGGGARGLISIQALKYIERRAGRPIHRLFDFVSGTSTGALQALALTKPQPLSGVGLEHAYLEMLPRIFDRRLLALGGLTGPLYPHEPLEAALRETLGHDPLAYCRIPAAVATYSLTQRQPVMLGSYNAYSHMPLWEAARASSAAPTFFEPF
jgi:patatin-like phospholipase/acyl hydrolase